MTMKAFLVLAFVSLAALIVFAQFRTTQKSLPAGVLERPIYAHQRNVLNTPEAFRASLLRAKVAGGAVMLVGCQEDLKRQWNPQGEPLGQVLNEMTAVDKSYRWEVQDGAVNLLPTAGEPPLLQTRVGELKIDTRSSWEALSQIKGTPEVQQAMVGLRLKGGVTIITYSPRPTPFSIRFKGGTLRQALNAIALAHGSDVWDYQEIRCGERNELILRF
jgi:hypothetical protein